MSATSTTNAADAIEMVLEKARISLNNIADNADTWVDKQSAVLANDKTPEYQVTVKMTLRVSKRQTPGIPGSPEKHCPLRQSPSTRQTLPIAPLLQFPTGAPAPLMQLNSAGQWSPLWQRAVRQICPLLGMMSSLQTAPTIPVGQTPDSGQAGKL